MSNALALNTYTEEITLAERMNTRLLELKMTKQELAMRINFSRSAVSKYLNGKYESDPTEIEKNILQFLQDTAPNDGNNSTVGNIVPIMKEKPQFFESPDFVSVIAVCQACQENSTVGIVVGRTGYGKSHALKKYATLKRVAYLESNEFMNCKDFIRKIEAAIGMPKGKGSVDERMEEIVSFFKINKGYLLVVDEADKLITRYSQKKIEMLRYMSDSAAVGVVIAGEPVLEADLKMYDERFANRMSFHHKLKGLARQDIEQYLTGYEVDADALDELVMRGTNKRTGCFRLFDRTLNNVLRILKETGETRISMKVVGQASNMMML